MNKQSGFTLVELLIAIVVLGIMVSMAVPSFRSTMQRNQALSTANELLADLQLARSEAIKQDRLIDVCSSIDATTCGGTWADGWIVVPRVDPADPAEPPISVREKPATGMSFSGANTITYRGTGRNTPVGSQTVSVIQGTFQYNVIISATGRPGVIKI